MRLSSYFFVAITFLFAFILLFLGVYFLLFPFLPFFRATLLSFLTEADHFYWLLGLILLLFGMILMVATFFVTKKDRYLVSMHSRGPLEVESTVIRTMVEHYLKERYTLSSFDLFVRKGKISMSLDLPFIDFASQRAVTLKLQEELTAFLESKFDYRQDYYLTVSFN